MLKIDISNIERVFKSKIISVESAKRSGYELIKEFFVDNSGFGSYNEPALLKDSFINELSLLIDEIGTVYTSLTNVGQFQVYVGVFKYVGKNEYKNFTGKVATKYKDNNNEYSLYYHDTEVVYHNKKENTIKLDSGGWQTQTTKSRINDYIYSFGYQIQQYLGERYIINYNNCITGKKDLQKKLDSGIIKEFFDGITFNY